MEKCQHPLARLALTLASRLASHANLHVSTEKLFMTFNKESQHKTPFSASRDHLAHISRVASTAPAELKHKTVKGLVEYNFLKKKITL